MEHERSEVMELVQAFLAGGRGMPEAHPGSEELLERLTALQPYDLAELLPELTPEDRLALISGLPLGDAASVVEYLEPEDQYRLLHRLDPTIAAPLLAEMSSDEVVDLLLSVHPNQAARLRDWLPNADRDKITRLLSYPEGTAGSLASIDYVAGRGHWTVEHALAHIRKVASEADTLSYIYVLDARGRLIGVVSLRQLFLADAAQTLAEIAHRDLITSPAAADQEEAARLLARYDFVALPVVDDEGRLVGIVTVDDVVDVIHEEAAEDIQKLGGSQPLSESYFKTSIASLFKKRVGWLLILFIAESYTTAVLGHFQAITAQMVALTFFIPLLTGTGGNIGSQTVATLVRALAVGEVVFRDVLRVAARELATGALLGVAMGFAGWLLATVRGAPFELGEVVAVSALFIVVWASIVAAALPLTLHRFGVDPAVVSGPLITTLVDGTGLFLYFTVARLLLGLG